ncbi:hypothetical protein KCU85_g6920, partial [Aureobasidium melanogenum]
MILGSDIHISATIFSQPHLDPTTRCTYAQVAITIHHDDCLAFVSILQPALDTRRALAGLHSSAESTTPSNPSPPWSTIYPTFPKLLLQQIS